MEAARINRVNMVYKKRFALRGVQNSNGLLRIARSNKWKYKTPFTKNKFMCSKHGETKQTKMSEFGAKKGLLQG